MCIRLKGEQNEMKLLYAIRNTNKVALVWIFVWVLFFCMDYCIGLKEEMCSVGVNIIGNDYYRLFTGLLLHINLFHILGNSIAIYFVGQFLNGKMNHYILFGCSIVAGITANLLFAVIRPNAYMIGGSPVVYALIGFVVILQKMRKELPRFQTKTLCQWILGYAIIGNYPFFSKDFSELIVHTLGFSAGIAFAFMTCVFLSCHRKSKAFQS